MSVLQQRPPRLSPSRRSESQRKSKRQSSLPPEVARLYSTVAWRRRRKSQLDAEPLCRACRKERRITKATVADHIERATDEQSFWHGALQSLCATHHNAKRQAESKGNQWRSKMRGCDASGIPLDPEHEWSKSDQRAHSPYRRIACS